MNKKLIALAIAGACAAPTAMAQTANPVTLYGRVYLTVESVEAKGGSGPLSSRTRIEDQSSLLGVRGTEDLGGGLKAFFQLETAFRADQNNTTPTSGVAQPFGTRNSGVGLQGGFGSILIGRWDMPFKLATIAIDPYGDLTISGITGTLSDRGNFDRREQNVLQYWSPNIGGFAFRAAVSANEGKGAGLNPRDFGASVTFTRGPIYVFGAWEKHEDVSATLRNEEAWAVGGAVTFGPVKVGAQYQKIEKNTFRDDQDNFMLNAVFTFGKNQIIVQGMKSENQNVVGAECESLSVGYQYNFTRRTFFIASYIDVDNNAVSNCNFGSNALPITAGNGTTTFSSDPRGFFAGLRHVF